MGQSSFQRKLIESARDAAAIEVHCQEDPPEVRMRSIKVFAWDRRTSQTKAIFHIIIADGCLFYGNDALRSRGGCCICLLMASGLTAKRFSMWVADVDEGEFYYTISSEQFKLAVFIILPRLVYTSRQCVSQSEMGDSRSGGYENTTKDFLTYSVRLLSRLLVGKTKGQEVCWKYPPQNWPYSWKNPTSSPKDSSETLLKKYHYLRSLVPNENLSQEEQMAFQDFEAGNLDNVKSFMLINKWKDSINDMMNMSHSLQQPYKMLFYGQVKHLYDIVSSSVASTSGCPTAADTSSSTLSKKRKPVSLKSLQSKKCKTEKLPKCGNNIQNNSRTRSILPKPTQTSNKSPTVFLQSTVLSGSSVVESPVISIFPHKSQQSLVYSNNTMSNTVIDISNCSPLPHHPDTAAATNVLSSAIINPIITIHTPDNPLLGSNEELSKAVSQSNPISSLDSGAWSQESSISKEACDVRLDEQKLNDKDVQDNLQFISNTTNQNNYFDPIIFMNFDP